MCVMLKNNVEMAQGYIVYFRVACVILNLSTIVFRHGAENNESPGGNVTMASY